MGVETGFQSPKTSAKAASLRRKSLVIKGLQGLGNVQSCSIVSACKSRCCAFCETLGVGAGLGAGVGVRGPEDDGDGEREGDTGVGEEVAVTGVGGEGQLRGDEHPMIQHPLQVG